MAWQARCAAKVAAHPHWAEPATQAVPQAKLLQAAAAAHSSASEPVAASASASVHAVASLPYTPGLAVQTQVSKIVEPGQDL